MANSSAATATDPDVLVHGGPTDFLGFCTGWAEVALGLDQPQGQHTEHRRHSYSGVHRSSRYACHSMQHFRRYLSHGTMCISYEGKEFARQAMDYLIPLDGAITESQSGRNGSSKEAAKEYLSTTPFGHLACNTASIGTVLDSMFRGKGTTR